MKGFGDTQRVTHEGNIVPDDRVLAVVLMGFVALYTIAIIVGALLLVVGAAIYYL